MISADEKDMIEAALKEPTSRVNGPQGAAAKLGIPRQLWSQRFGRSKSTTSVQSRQCLIAELPLLHHSSLIRVR